MKELKTKIVDFQVKQRQKLACCQRLPVNNSLVTPRREPKPRGTNAIAPLQPRTSQLEQPQPFENRWEQLAAQAQRINQLASELETAMFELKAIANTINCQRQMKHDTPQPLRNTCQFLTAIVPDVKRHKASGFVLTTRTVDLFQAEREAEQLARSLRQRENRKQLGSQLSSYKRRFLGWLF